MKQTTARRGEVSAAGGFDACLFLEKCSRIHEIQREFQNEYRFG